MKLTIRNSVVEWPIERRGAKWRSTGSALVNFPSVTKLCRWRCSYNVPVYDVFIRVNRVPRMRQNICSFRISWQLPWQRVTSSHRGSAVDEIHARVTKFMASSVTTSSAANFESDSRINVQASFLRGSFFNENLLLTFDQVNEFIHHTRIILHNRVVCMLLMQRV